MMSAIQESGTTLPIRGTCKLPLRWQAPAHFHWTTRMDDRSG